MSDYLVYVQRKNVQDVVKLSEEFEGNIPNIEITSATGDIFHYKCAKTKQNLRSACSSSRAIDYHDLTQCYECLGYNRSFARFYYKNAHCSECGMRLDFGYFILIFLLEKAELLPKKFKMFCCTCYISHERKKNIKELAEVLSDGEER